MTKKEISKMVSFRLPIVDYAKLASISYRLYGTYNISKTIKLLIYSFITDEYDNKNH